MQLLASTTQQLQTLGVQQQRTEFAVTAEKLLHEGVGLLVAQERLHEKLGKWLFPDPPRPPEPSVASMAEMIQRYLDIFEELNKEVKSRDMKADELIGRAR